MPIALRRSAIRPSHAPQVGQLNRGRARTLIGFGQQEPGPRPRPGPSSRRGSRPWRASWSARSRPTPESRSIAAPSAAARAACASSRDPKAVEAEKGLVDRVDFQGGREAAENAHDAPAHVAIEGVVRRADDHALRIDPLPAQVPRLAHADAERLGLVRAGDHTAIVVRQHDHRLAAQLRLKHPFAAGVEIIAVDESDRSRHVSIRIPLVTTPHTSKPESSPISISG